MVYYRGLGFLGFRTQRFMRCGLRVEMPRFIIGIMERKWKLQGI